MEIEKFKNEIIERSKVLGLKSYFFAVENNTFHEVRNNFSLADGLFLARKIESEVDLEILKTLNSRVVPLNMDKLK